MNVGGELASLAMHSTEISFWAPILKLYSDGALMSEILNRTAVGGTKKRKMFNEYDKQEQKLPL